MPDGTLLPGYTFNPWQGCAKVSAGCKNCFAEAMTKRFSGAGFWGAGGERKFQTDDYWEKPFAWNKKAKKLGVRLKVFCGSMCDVFEDREDLIEYRVRLYELISLTPHLDWLLLTKRPENIIKFYVPWFGMVKPVENVWLGVSVENQEMADLRIPELLKIPAKVRFLSCEPLLEEIDLEYPLRITGWNEDAYENIEGAGVDWVIVGGESGPKKRPFAPDWARSIRDQCQDAKVPFFMKQINKVKPIPDDLMIREFPNVYPHNFKRNRG